MAHLLGVVGTDVPEADLREAMSPHIVSEIYLIGFKILIIFILFLFMIFSWVSITMHLLLLITVLLSHIQISDQL